MFLIPVSKKVYSVDSDWNSLKSLASDIERNSNSKISLFSNSDDILIKRLKFNGDSFSFQDKTGSNSGLVCECKLVSNGSKSTIETTIKTSISSMMSLIPVMAYILIFNLVFVPIPWWWQFLLAGFYYMFLMLSFNLLVRRYNDIMEKGFGAVKV